MYYNYNYSGYDSYDPCERRKLVTTRTCRTYRTNLSIQREIGRLKPRAVQSDSSHRTNTLQLQKRRQISARGYADAQENRRIALFIRAPFAALTDNPLYEGTLVFRDESRFMPVCIHAVFQSKKGECSSVIRRDMREKEEAEASLQPVDPYSPTLKRNLSFRVELSFQPSNLILRPVLTEYFAPFERHRKRERSHSSDALALRRDAQASFLPVQARGLDLSRKVPAFAELNEICECEACVRCRLLLDCNRQFWRQIFDNYSCKHLDMYLYGFVFVNV